MLINVNIHVKPFNVNPYVNFSKVVKVNLDIMIAHDIKYYNTRGEEGVYNKYSSYKMNTLEEKVSFTKCYENV